MHARTGRRRAWRRPLVASLATGSLIAMMLAAGSPAHSAGRGAPRAASLRIAPLDARSLRTISLGSDRTRQARVDLARRLGGQAVIQGDPVTGTARFVGRLNGYLTSSSRRPATRIAMGFVRSNLTTMGLTRPDLQTFRFASDYVDISGTHHLSWTQASHGITVFQNGLRASVTADGRLVNLTGSPVHGLRANTHRPRIGAAAAIRTAAGSYRLPAKSPLTRDVAKPVLFVAGHGARLAWRVVAWRSTHQLDLVVVDAVNGRILYRQSLTDDATGTASAWEFYPSDLLPSGANTANPVTFPVVNGSRLSGDDAYVWADVKDNNKPDKGEDIAAQSGTDWAVPAVLDTSNAAQHCTTSRPCTWNPTVPFSWKTNEAQDAAQLMYYLTKYHDHLASAPYGFTSASGNFEAGGGDPVDANAMDGANSMNGLPDKFHFNNANMSTPPDGSSPLMQMYLFRAASSLPIPSGNGGDDAEVVYHEYTHGLTNRLVLYPDGTSGLTTQQSNSMGEGWSDWYAEDFLNNEGFKPDTGAIGDVVMGAMSFGGFLRSNAVDCPVGAVAPTCPGGVHTGAGGYTYGDFGKVAGAPEVHADGEIWLETLWQLRQTLGAATAETLVTRALELSPPAPSYLDMRNAIVQADTVNFGGANHSAIWSVFASRGMGFFAASIDGSDVSPVEDFSTPPDCSITTCATISGKLTDKYTGKPAVGVTVGFAGLDSGFDWDLADTTDATGSFTITNIPLHTYPELLVTGGGYEPGLAVNVPVTGDLSLTAKLIRDWVSPEGGAKIGEFTPPDYSGFGCGPAQLVDLNGGTGWGSDAPNSTYGSKVKGPRSVVIKLPEAVNLKNFGLVSYGACGDPPKAGFKGFEIDTQAQGSSRWVVAFKGSIASDGRLHVYTPHAGKKNVRSVRFVMLSNHGDKLFMDAIELLVRGT